ncbi:DUF4333 domain-containing protein [Nocardia tengchongensis]
MPMRVGAIYTCTVNIGGEPKTVAVQVSSNDGSNFIGRPS